jgi:hypothetical protein
MATSKRAGNVASAGGSGAPFHAARRTICLEHRRIGVLWPGP